MVDEQGNVYRMTMRVAQITGVNSCYGLIEFMQNQEAIIVNAEYITINDELTDSFPLAECRRLQKFPFREDTRTHRDGNASFTKDIMRNLQEERRIHSAGKRNRNAAVFLQQRLEPFHFFMHIIHAVHYT